MSHNNTENNKRVAKNTFALYFRMLLTMLVTLYTSRIILNVLGVEDYGVYNIVAGIVVMIDFINAALYGASLRFMTYVMDDTILVRNRIFSTIKFVHFLISIFTIIIGETIGIWFLHNFMVIPPERLEAAVWVFHFTLLMLALCEMNLPYTALMMAYEKMTVFAYFSILEVGLKFFVAVVLLYLSYDKLISYAVLLFLIQCFVRTFYLHYCRRNFVEAKVSMHLYKQEILKIGKFTNFTLLGTMSNVLMFQGTNILLNLFFGPIINASRGISVQVDTAINKLCSGFLIAVKPQVIKSYSCNDYNRVKSLFIFSSKVSIYLTLLIVTPILYFTPNILTLWLGDFPIYTVEFVRIILIQELFYSLSYPIVALVEATGDIKRFQVYSAISNLLFIPIGYLSLKYANISPNILMLIMLFFSVITFILRLAIVLKIVKLSFAYYMKYIINPTLYTFAFVIFGYFYIPSSLDISIINVFVYSLCVILSLIIVIYLSGVTKRERELINRYVCSIFTKILQKNKTK